MNGKRLMEKIILITGGGRGIGAACALLAAQQGYTVCINYRTDREAASRVITGIEDSGGRGLAIQADMADETDVERLFASVDAVWQAQRAHQQRGCFIAIWRAVFNARPQSASRTVYG
jgi:NAD(P)-dependent dehydrogenase (short-subunit alcohol dehydrogenase family)